MNSYHINESKKQSEYQNCQREKQPKQTRADAIDVPIETGLYRVGLILPLVFALVWVGYRYLSAHSILFRMPCALYTLTGYYCPGCGGTRAVEALLRLRLLQSFVYHPVVVYGAGVYVWFMISHTVERISVLVGKRRMVVGLRWHPRWMWFAVVIVFLNCMVKNAALFFFGLDLLDAAFF